MILTTLKAAGILSSSSINVSEFMGLIYPPNCAVVARFAKLIIDN
jgi:hypothetical protein